MYTLLARGLSVLRETAIMPQLVNRGHSLDAATKGQTVNVPFSTAKTPYNISPSSTPKAPGDVVTGTIPITLDQWKGSNFHLSDKERTQIEKNENFIPMEMAEAMRGLGNAVNDDLLARYWEVYGYVGTAATTPFSNSTDRTATKDATLLNTKLNDQLCPKTQRQAVVGSDAEAEMLALPQFANLDKSGDSQVVTEATMGRKYGFNWHSENAIVTHTAGTPGGTPLVVGAHAADATARSGLVAVDGLTITVGDYHKGDVVTFAGHSQTYTVTALMTASGTGTGTLAIAPGLQASLADDAVVTLKASHVVNLGFHPQAFALATAPFETDLLGGAETVSLQDPITGLVVRLEVIRQTKQTMWEFDILWGSKCVRPEFAARLAG
jgi:hypothetical protein